MTPRSETNARLMAARALVALFDDSDSTHPDDIPETALSDRDRAFSRNLYFGTLRWRTGLEWLAGELLNKPLRARDRDIHFLILIGLLQLWKEQTPAHAAIHETVAATRQTGKAWAGGLVNAVLRNFQRQESKLLRDLENHTARFSHPDWLLEKLQADWPDRWSAIIEANNERAPMWLRCNQQLTQPEDYLASLRSAGLEGTLSPIAPEAIQVSSPSPVDQLPGFSEGLVSIQDLAPQLAVSHLAAEPGHRVLDACAAPGGKTCHILERTPGVALTALDRSPNRIQLIKDNLSRLRLDCTVIEADARQADQWWDGKTFNRILLDAPCSATGIIRRHPEIKWLRTPEHVMAAVRTQGELLNALWPLLEPGGILVYATCSVLKCENVQQIEQFLCRSPDAQLLEIPSAYATDGQIHPGVENMDGFYYARLSKHA